MRRAFLLAYILFLLLVTVFSYTFTDANLIYLKPFLPQAFDLSEQVKTVFYCATVVFFFLFYAGWISLIKKGIIKSRDIRFGIYTTVAILSFSYSAMLSHDIFNYIASAKTLFSYHENPYLVMPIEFLHDPLILFMHAANKTALYAPLWILLTGIPFFFSFGNFIALLFTFKLFTAIFFLGTVFLLWKMSRDSFGIVLFAFNPLILIETLISNHNDIVMMFFALFALSLFLKKKYLLSFFSLFASILIKYATVFLVPLFLYSFWARSRGEKVPDEKIYNLSLVAMVAVFILSPLREEIYPWYATWMLIFLPFVYKNRLFFWFLIALSGGLLLRYVPYMILLTYFGITPLLKTTITVLPVVFVLCCFFINKVWLKK